MDKNVLKKFAIESRQELMEKVANKINRYFVDEEFNVNQNGEVYVLVNDKHTLRLTKSEYENRQLLVKRINEITLEQVIEEAAYTWFNRIIAIRYMEIHDYLPLTKGNQSLGVRVLSSKDNTPDPEIMKISNLINPDLDISFNKEYYGSIQDNNKRFEYILLLVCKKLGKVIPQVFDGITDYIDILVPDNLLNESGYVTKVLNDIPIINFEKVEIIGWLYQYYNQIEKDRVITAKKAYKKTEIPFATQLFTPNWIVKYMVENSLGKFWLEHSNDNKLHSKWEYYIDVKNELSDYIDPILIKCIDPCSGSGHVLIYMFEVLFQIYSSYGYSQKDIPKLILKNNLYGIDIDDRACQLSILSVILKAREYDKNIFSNNVIRDLNILSIQESNNITTQYINVLINYTGLDEKSEIIQTLKYVHNIFNDAKEIGSLLKVDSKNYDQVIDKIMELYDKEISLYDSVEFNILINKIIPILKQAKMLSEQYDVVVTNPPYMGERYMSEITKNYIRNEYFIGRADMFSSFILRTQSMCKKNGMIGLITPYAWMFLDSYKDLREFMISNMSINTLTQLEFNAFEVAALPVCTFTLKNNASNLLGSYIKLSDFPGADKQPIKVLEAIHNKDVYYFYTCNMDQFKKIDGYPISFWLSDNMRNVFSKSKKINDFGIAKQGMVTGDNKKFLRLWFEPNFKKIKLDAKNLEEAKNSKKKWFPYNKGGKYRKWYGNNEYVVNYQNDGEEVKEYTSHLPQGTAVRIKSRDYYFKEAITWTFISIDIGVRYSKCGAIFDVAGSSLFVNDKYVKYILGFMCSKLMKIFNQVINPTMNVQTSNVAQLPLILNEKKLDFINSIVDENIKLSKEDWDSYELSWDFSEHPLIKYKCQENLIKNVWKNWEKINTERFEKIKANEELLNKTFIEIYGLEDEIDYNIEDKDITLKRANLEYDIKSFINYSVGCMFGRYSLDENGLVFAGGSFNNNAYNTFKPDKDNIIPITEEYYFNDDIISRFKDFLTTIYGKESLYENLDFIANVLGNNKGENSENYIKKYFVEEFFNTHCDFCSVLGSGKRPIYWLFDSGKKNGFKCLIYMHRYNEGIVSKIRLDYLHRIQNTYEKELKEISDKLNGDLDLTTKRKLSKKQADISAKLQETNEYDEKIAHIADQKIKIDLDDGVTMNYAKFSVKNPKTGKEESILAKIK